MLLTGWPHYSEATPLNPEVALSGFPVFISASRIPLLWEFVREDLGDIRATDSGNNRLPCHVVHYDYTGCQALIAVNVNKTTGNQPIRIWFGNSTGVTEAIDSEYGQWNTYYSGIKAFYPSGHGQDVTRYQNHITGTPSNPDENPILLTGGPMPGSYAAKYDFAAGDATGYRYHRSGYFAGGTGTLTTFTKPIQFGTHPSFFSESTLIALSNLGPDTPAGEELAYGLSHQSGTNQFWYNKGDGVRHVISAQEASSTGSWHHIGASFQIGETEVVFNDGLATSTTDLSSQVNGVDSIHLGGISSSFMVESEQRYGAGSHRGAMSLTFIHDEFQPAEWSKYLYQAGDQDTFLPTWDTHISGLWGKSRTNTLTNGVATKFRLFNANSNTRTSTRLFVNTATGLDFPTYWNGYYELTPINPSGNLTGFPLLLDLTLLSGIASRLRLDGEDIRVTDTNNNLIPSDLIYYSGGTGLLAMNPGVKNTTSQTFRFWYGNDLAERPHANSMYGQWNTYYSGMDVYFPSGIWNDRTRNQRHLSTSGTVTPTYPITGLHRSNVAALFGTAGNNHGFYTGETTATGANYTYISWNFSTGLGQRSHICLAQRGTAAFEYNATRTSAGFAFDNKNTTASLTTPFYATGRWNHIVGRSSGTGFSSMTRDVFSSGIIAGTQTGHQQPVTGIDNLFVGLIWNAGATSPMRGLMTLAQIHNNAVSNPWVSYDYQMGLDQSGFWGGSPSVGSVIMDGAEETRTDTFGSVDRDRGMLSNSYTNTSSLNSIKLVYGLATQSNTKTSYTGTIDLDELITQSLEGIIGTRTSSSLRINLAVTFNVASPTRTQETSTVSLLKQLQAYINTLTAENGDVTVTRNLSILGEDGTRTSTTCSLDIESSSIAGIVSVLTRLTGSLTLLSESNGEIVEFPVYITLNSEGNYIITRNHATIQTIIGEG
jgi:hypothetical protein